MLGIEVQDAKAMQEALRQSGILVGTAGGNTLRLVPPLIFQKEHADEFLSAFRSLIVE